MLSLLYLLNASDAVMVCYSLYNITLHLKHVCCSSKFEFDFETLLNAIMILIRVSLVLQYFTMLVMCSNFTHRYNTMKKQDFASRTNRLLSFNTLTNGDISVSVFKNISAFIQRLYTLLFKKPCCLHCTRNFGT